MPKVFLIEDDRTMLSLLGTLLRMEGFDVVSIKNESTIVELVESLRLQQPDVALVDIHIHQMNGFDLLQTVRADETLKHIRILMSSGLDRSFDCMQAGADGFILKPYMPDQLIQHIRQILSSSQ